VCAACHTSGAAGAPKIGVAADWGPRLAQGYDTLVKHAIEGIRAMPPKGGNPDLENVEVERALVYMANQSGAKFKEPAVPAPGAAPAAGTEIAAAPVAANAATAAPVAGTPASATPAAAPTAAAPAAAPAAPAAAAPAVANADAGKALFNSACIACHGPGVAGAPKVADKAAWAPRIKQGNAVLYEHAIKGYQGKSGVMPPKGGSAAPDADVKAAVDFMVASSR
jgi:cytochrome c5